MIYKGKVFLALFLYIIDFAKNVTAVKFKGRWSFVQNFTKGC